MTSYFIFWSVSAFLCIQTVLCLPQVKNLVKRSNGNERISFKECNLSQEERIDCGHYGIKEETCHARECCWQESDSPSVPWCYHTIPTIGPQCLMELSERVDCGWENIRKEQCVASGCCWMPTGAENSKIPWCFETKRVPIYEGECGKPKITPKTMSRVIGGEDAVPHSWPWMVTLQQNGDLVCGGSLINHQWVLSAAHCARTFLDSFGDDNNTVLLGAQSLSDNEDTKISIKMADLFPHEQYGFSPDVDGAFGGVHHDILLIRLESPVAFSDVISPVCLAPSRASGGQRCYSSGWGLDSFSYSEVEGLIETRPDILQQFMSPVVDNEVCNQEDWYNGRVHDTAMCAGYEEGGRGNCFGDSGGPLVCEEDGVWSQVGVVSWAEPCALARFPTVYGEVSQFIKWMEQTIAGYDGI